MSAGQHSEGRAGLGHDGDCDCRAHAVLPLLHLEVVQQRHQHVLRAAGTRHFTSTLHDQGLATACRGCPFGLNCADLPATEAFNPTLHMGLCFEAHNKHCLKDGAVNLAHQHVCTKQKLQRLTAHLGLSNKAIKVAACNNIKTSDSQGRSKTGVGHTKLLTRGCTPGAQWPWRCSRTC